MAYNTKPIVTDVDGNPISQYYNPDTDSYEPVEGSHGANKVTVENNDLSLILDKLSQLTGTVIDEETRKTNELERISKETDRVTAENNRVSAESTRVSNENIRKSNETARQTSESDRVSAETLRENAESTRVSQENTRQSQESIRESNEDARQSNEDIRIESENTRITNENIRKANELERIENEDARQSNEDIRNTNEIARVEDEDVRIQNENARVQNENIRQSNEQNRIDLYNDLIDKVNSGYFDGKNLEFHWDGTKLGVRVEGETEYIYVDLKGETGDIENLTIQHVINALGYTPIKSVNNMVADEAGNVELDIDTSEIENRIGNVEDDLVAHKAENASQDNVHGLRSANLALGENSLASGYQTIALGINSLASGGSSVALGRNANATEGSSVAVGYSSKASGKNSFAMGHLAKAVASASFAMGYNSSAEALNSLALGYLAKSLNADEGVLGGLNILNKWIVPGAFTVNGTKNFEIPHPKPEKNATHVIRHGAVESPTAGDTLYRWKVKAVKDNDTVTIDLPDYFIYLNKNVQIFVTPQGHFGNGYGILNKEIEQLEIHCQYEGEYNVLVIGTRNDDHQSVQDWDIKGVEREIGESWTGETYVFSVDEILEIEEIKEVV